MAQQIEQNTHQTLPFQKPWKSEFTVEQQRPKKGSILGVSGL